MNVFRSFTVALIVGCAALLSGCAKYRPHQFHDRPLAKSDKVQVSARLLQENDARYYFGRRIVSKGFQPILLTINNPTPRAFMLDAWDINLKLEHDKTIIRAIDFSPAQRIIAWSVLGLFLWPFFIPAAVDGVMASQANKDMAQDFADRVLSCDSYVKVRSYATMTKVMFVKKEHAKKSFTVVLSDRETREKTTFNVNAQ